MVINEKMQDHHNHIGPTRAAILKKSIVVLIAVLPFFSLLLHHYIAASAGMLPTGFIAYDMAYYAAQGREIFEAGGNGWAYANAYDPGSPTIYFHWLVWLLGFSTKILHIDPGIVFIILGLLAGLLLSWLTYSVVEAVLPKPEFHNLLFLIVMWGGGLLVSISILRNFVYGDHWANDLMRFDPAVGTWFLNWGRNTLLSTEALYHSLVAIIWLSLIRQKWSLAIATGLALAATHPFSGLQFMLILSAYLGFLIVTGRQRIRPLYLVILAAGFGLFLAYYFIFLPSFETHRAIHDTWSLEWILPATSAILAYSPVGILAAKKILGNRLKLSEQDWLFVISFIISFLLANHNWFISPRQPLHFTRGYIWMPLALLALPELQRIFVKVATATKPFISAVFCSIVLFIFALDNLGFLYTSWSGAGAPEMYLSRDERGMYTWIDESELTGMLLYPNSLFSSYLVATYTEMYPFLGHWSLTPDYVERGKMVSAWMKAGGSPAWMGEIDYLLIREGTLPPNFEAVRWTTVHRAGDLILYQQTE